MSRKLLTLDDLYAFFSNHARSSHFSAKDVEDEIVVSLPSTMCFEEGEGGDKEGLTPVHLKACHTGRNVNKTFISEEVTTTALPSFSNRPILSYIYKDDDGNYQFRDHAKHINEDGEIEYDERPIGVIPESCNAHLEYDAEADKTYVHVDGYLFDEYSKAKDILEREGECSVSVEIAVRDFSYNAKDKLLVFNDFYYEGVTILGKREDGTPVLPGMEGSNIKIADFKKKNNVMFSQESMMDILNQINNKLNQLTIQNTSGKEELNVEDQKTMPVAEEPIVEEETQIVEPETVVTEPEVEAVETEEVVEAETEEVTESTPEATEPEATEPEAAPAEAKFTKMFELAHDDVRRGLYELLAIYESENNDYCWIEKVYDNYFIYSSEKDGQLYKQPYSKVDDALAFEGERTHLNAEYVTDDELTILNEMRSNYATLIEKLAQYESEPDKLKVLESKDYALIKDTDEYKKLCDRKTYFTLTIDEIKSRCEAMLVEKAKELGSQYSSNEQPKVEYSSKPLVASSQIKSGKGKYGGMFVK